jgi:beta-lactamase regulating signal transducer with metallopeptidase domain
VRPAEATRGWARLWPGFVLALWTVIGASSLAALLASWTCLRRCMLGREVLRDGPLLARFERLRERTRVRACVRLSVSSRIAAPFSTGLLRPEVCVPRAALTELTGAQQDALLAHELAHLVRRDPAWFGIGFLIEKLFFFQPLNRLARRQLSELAEVACDDWAVRWTGARLALASCLTEVAGWVIGEKPRLVTPPGLAGHRSRLAQRVQRLLDDPPRAGRRAARAVVAAARRGRAGAGHARGSGRLGAGSLGAAHRERAARPRAARA